MDALFSSLPPLALALFLCLVLGRLLLRFGIPRVTVYLLVGVIVGPQGLAGFLDSGDPSANFLLGADAHEVLAQVKLLAIGFILFRVGGEFTLPSLRRMGPRIGLLSASEVIFTGALVAGAIYLATGEAALALIGPMLATSSAPSATLLTLREVEAEGPTSRALILLVGLNNLITLLAFPVILSWAFAAGDPGAAMEASLLSLGGGLLLGFLAAVCLETFNGIKEYAVLGTLVVLGSIGIAHLAGGPPTGTAMLACFGAGFVVTNGSPRGTTLFETLDGIVYPLYVLFFIGSGAELHLEQLAHLGLLGALFIAARTVGKVYGTRIGLRLARLSDELSPQLGAGLLCQAGVALGLVAALADVVPEASADLRDVVLASVVFFELLGPYMTRRTAVGAGEVKLANLMPSAQQESGLRALSEVTRELSRSLGTPHFGRRREGGELTVRHLTRRAPESVRENLPFESVLKTMGEAHLDQLPVVNEAGELLGLISFQELKDIIYDPHLRDLVIAADLMNPVARPLGPETSLQEALELLDEQHAQSWPVIEDERLYGMLRRQDVYAVLRRAFRGGNGS